MESSISINRKERSHSSKNLRRFLKQSTKQRVKKNKFMKLVNWNQKNHTTEENRKSVKYYKYKTKIKMGEIRATYDNTIWNDKNIVETKYMTRNTPGQIA